MKLKKTLLVITEDSPESYSPSGERIRHMALALRHSFERTIVLALGGGGTHEKIKTEPAVSLHSISFVSIVPFPVSGLFDPIKFLMLFAHSLILCWHHKPSHIIASMPPLETGACAWLLTKVLRVKLLIDLRDDWESAFGSQLMKYFPSPLVALLSRFSKEIYSRATSILVVTQPIANAIHRRGVATPTILVPNGADTSIFLPKDTYAVRKTRLNNALPLNKLVMVYCGSGINPYYRLDLILLSIKALPEDVRKRLFLAFYVYNGSDHLKEMKSRLQIPDDLLEVRNPLQRSKLAEVIGSCDVGLVPFDEDAYLLCARSTKLYEYLSAGLFVISSGPVKGELDVFFSSNSRLGLFTKPTVEGFCQAFQVADKAKSLYDYSLRMFRHLFIRESYDRENIMTSAMKILFQD